MNIGQKYLIMRKAILIASVSLLLFQIGCASRKVKVQVRNDPNYQGGRSYSKTLSGNLFAVQIYDSDTKMITLAPQIIFEMRSMLEPKGFKFTENQSQANILIAFTIKRKNKTLNVPAQFSLGSSWNKFGGGTSAGFTGKHEEDVTDESIIIQIVDCKGQEKPTIFVEGFSWPKRRNDVFLDSDERVSIAIDKLVSESLIGKMQAAPAIRETASQGCK